MDDQWDERLVRCEKLSLLAWIVRCDELSLTIGLNKFLGYLATLVLDLVCSKQIYSIFVHGLVKDESHR
jgi:hypothetical protein